MWDGAVIIMTHLSNHTEDTGFLDEIVDRCGFFFPIPPQLAVPTKEVSGSFLNSYAWGTLGAAWARPSSEGHRRGGKEWRSGKT